MQHGKEYVVEMITLTKDMKSKSSNKITLVCPVKPSSPKISKLQSLSPNSVAVGWKITEPRSVRPCDNVASYQIFLNGVFHGEETTSNAKTYTHVIYDLIAGNSYNVTVQVAV